MVFSLPALPFSVTSLEPHISARTVEIHHGKHHQAYISKLNELIEGTPLAGQSLEDIMQTTAHQPEKTAVFNNAAQVWNHNFYWHSLQPNGGGVPPAGLLRAELEMAFGSVGAFQDLFCQAALTQFGSGWAWLVLDASGKLAIVKTGNADCPLVHGMKPLLVCDVWEHAYYLDYQNKRADYVKAIVNHLVNWPFVQRNFHHV